MRLNIDTQRLKPVERTLERCKVLTIPAGSAPKNVTVQLPGADGAKVDARYTGFPPIAVNDYVSVRFSPNEPIKYTIVGTSGETPVTVSGWPFAKAITVSATDPDADYTTIADAITAAATGDTILIDPGTYTVTSALALNKNITLIGLDPARTIINCSTTSTACVNVTGAGAKIIGIGFTNSATGLTAEAVQIGASCTLVNVGVTKTGASTTGTAIYVYADSTVVMVDVDANCSGSSGDDRALRVDTATAAVVEMINGSLDGANYDVSVNSAGSTVLLRGTKLVNSTTQITTGSLTGHASQPDGDIVALNDVLIGTTARPATTAGDRAIAIRSVSERSFLQFWRESDSVANNDVVGQIGMYLGATTPTQVAAFLARAVDTAEDAARLTFWTKASGGSLLERLWITENGDIGINRSAPIGRLHGAGTLGSFAYWEGNDVDATTRTIVANGANDVANRVAGVCVAVESDGTRSSTSFFAVNNTAASNLAGTTGTFELRVQADGTFDIRRTAGTTTLDIIMLFIWF